MICRCDAIGAGFYGGTLSADQVVFGYGSLATEHGGAAVVLRGYRRVWGVAMENVRDLPGYKHYRLRSDGSRPDVFVAFVDLRPQPGWSVTGRCLPVDDAGLEVLDRRERNYRRVDVTADVDAAPAAAATVWAYLGSAHARGRFAAGQRSSSTVVSRDYLQLVRAGIAALGPGELEEFERTSGLERLAVWDLERVENL
jgi:Gamma-glutamyl cyclotransferase, AIG2-like